MPFRDCFRAPGWNFRLAGDHPCPLSDAGVYVFFNRQGSKDINRGRDVDTELAAYLASQAGSGREFAANNRDKPGRAFTRVIVKNVTSRNRRRTLSRRKWERTNAGKAITDVSLG